MITRDARTEKAPATHHPSHADCIACRSRQAAGLGLSFERQADESVVGRFGCDATFQGYADCVHGGVVAMLHDAAMTNCLFQRGIVGVTAKMSIRFSRSLEIGAEATVRAWVTRASPPGYRLSSEIVQQGVVRSTANGIFCEKRDAIHQA